MTIGITTVSLVYTSLLMLAKEHYTIPNFTMSGLGCTKHQNAGGLLLFY